MTVLAAHTWRNNAELIADVARLGYITGRVVDLTYGHGLFWTRYRPDQLVAHDRNPEKGDGVDFRRLPEPDGTYDTVVFDPPYKLSGTPALGDFDQRYGIDVPTRWQDRMALILDGTREAVRVCRPGGHVLVKCQDQVVSGAIRWQTREVAAVAESHGCVQVDRFDLLGKHRPQPAGRRQVHAQGRPSTLLVFRKATP